MPPPQVSADLLLPGRSNANAWTLSLPLGAGHLGSSVSPPSRTLLRARDAFPPQITPPPKCVHTKTIRVKPDRGELGPTGSPNVRETGIRTCPSRAQRLQASSSPSLQAALARRLAPPRPAVLTCDDRPGSPRPGQAQCGATGPLGLRAPKIPGAAELRARRRRRCSARPRLAV
jgi:hypothetical protein